VCSGASPAFEQQHVAARIRHRLAAYLIFNQSRDDIMKGRFICVHAPLSRLSALAVGAAIALAMSGDG